LQKWLLFCHWLYRQKPELNSATTIQKKAAFFLLVVFALSITPKNVFHEALAHHKDGLVCQHPDKKLPCFHRQAYHCSFDDLVVSAPFLATHKESVAVCFCTFAPFTFFYQPSILPEAFLQTESRGPPAT
jgi:hypothetical protein